MNPKNKSADSVVHKIIECIKVGNSYAQWIVRFETETDESIESYSTYRERTFDVYSRKLIFVDNYGTIDFKEFTISEEFSE